MTSKYYVSSSLVPIIILPLLCHCNFSAGFATTSILSTPPTRNNSAKLSSSFTCNNGRWTYLFAAPRESCSENGGGPVLVKDATSGASSSIEETPMGSGIFDGTARNTNSSNTKMPSKKEQNNLEKNHQHLDPSLALPLRQSVSPSAKTELIRNKRKMELAWCNQQTCQDAIREKVVGEHNHMELTGPATGQVVYRWEQSAVAANDNDNGANDGPSSLEEGTTLSASKLAPTPPAVLMLVKHEDEELTKVAAEAISRLTMLGIQVLMDSTLQNDLKKISNSMDEIGKNLDLDCNKIRLFKPRPVPGFGTGDQLLINGEYPKDDADGSEVDDCFFASDSTSDEPNQSGDGETFSAGLSDADLIVTLGGDGLLMHTSNVFSGPVPPILPVAGGSLGFLTPFSKEEMVEAILIALGFHDKPHRDGIMEEEEDPITMASTNGVSEERMPPQLKFASDNHICISMRMRLDCKIFDAEGILHSRYNVLNEVVIDRGSSPYLASLECFCDDVHLTTVQADGIIFATPTGSTAYSMAAGGSVVHPAVPAILVTPICPHVLSFRSMVFPDHVVLRCYVPSDARSTACVYFDGKHRTELKRGDSVQIEMSAHPVPTINRADHSSDWLSSLKMNFNFNTRVRQNPLP